MPNVPYRSSFFSAERVLFDVSTDYLLTGRSFETLHIQKQLSAAQDILAGLMKDLK